MILELNPTKNLKKLIAAAKNFFASIASIGIDDYDKYVLEKDMKPAYRQVGDYQQNPYSGAFSA